MHFKHYIIKGLEVLNHGILIYDTDVIHFGIKNGQLPINH